LEIFVNRGTTERVLYTVQKYDNMYNKIQIDVNFEVYIYMIYIPYTQGSMDEPAETLAKIHVQT